MFDITDVFFLSLMAMPNVKGYIWQEYIDAITKYNAEQIYRQATIDLQQQREIDITNDIYQNLIKRQQNARLNINGDKISGDIDLTLIGMNNKAKTEGIYSFDKNAKVKFIAVEDNATTKMCKSLDGKVFDVHDWNEFYRYSKTNDTIKKYRCYGLVQGLNLPPIDDGFHWCRSTIQYINTVENIQEIEYNFDIPKVSKDVKPLLKNIKLNTREKKLFNKYLTKDNIKIDNNLDIPMRYSEDKDKILVNPTHPNFKRYDIKESLTHEIVHMIDKRKNICVDNQYFLETQINLANIEIMNNKQKYYDLFMNDTNYELNMTISDIFSAVTNNKIRGAFYHDSSKWKIHSVKYSEVVSNIITADITNNLYSLKLIKEIEPLNRIRERLLKEYDII